MEVQALPINIFGPLPRGTLGFILGRSSTILRGIQIHPGVVDADYQGEIKIMTSVTQGVAVIPQGDRIAQLVLVPLVNTPTSWPGPTGVLRVLGHLALQPFG